MLGDEAVKVPPAENAANDQILLAFSLFTSWFGLLLFPLPLLIELPCIAILARRNSPLTHWAILASGWFVTFWLTAASTAIGYFTGNAEYYVTAFNAPSNLDRELRCYLSATEDGDLAPPYMPVFNFANNFTLRTLYALGGPVRNTYHGPYPTLKEAESLIAAKGVLLDEAAFKAGAIDVGTRHVHLPQRGIDQLEGGFVDYGDGQRKPAAQPQYAAAIGGDCLVIKSHGFWLFNCYEPRIALVDIATGEVFATYWPDTPDRI